MLAWLRARWLWILGGLLLVVGLYAAAGFWLVPKVARSQAIGYVDQKLGKQLSLGEIRFNPFTFRAEVNDVSVRDPDLGNARRRPLVSLKQAQVDFQLASLWNRAWTFNEVRLLEPYANAIIRADGSLNLVELIPESEEDDKPLPAIDIAHLAVTGGALDFADLSRQMQPSKRLAPITFELDHFQTRGAGSGFVLNAVGDQNERFNWSGDVALQPLASKGKFSVGGLQAVTAYEFLSEQLPVQLTRGRLDFAGQYDFRAGGADGLQLDGSLAKATASDLGLRKKGEDVDWVQLKQATLGNPRFSLGKRRVDIDSVVVDGLSAQAWMDKDGTINLLAMLEGDSTAVEPAPTADEGQAWAVHLASLTLQDAALAFEDRSVSPAASFELVPLAVTARDLSLDLQQPVPLTVQATINGKAPLSLDGEIVPAPFAATLQVSVEKLPLQEVRAYLPRWPKLELKSGEVAGKGELALAPEGSKPALSFKGEGSLARFRIDEARSHRELLSWERVDAEGIHYTMAPDSVSAQRVRARKPFAIVTVAEDRTINLVELFSDDAAAAKGSGKPSGGQDMPIKLARLDLLGATMAFADYSIEPNFSARIDALQGSIKGLSTAHDSVADIDLKGHVINKYSPVTIKGGTNIFAFDKHTDVAMTFRNIDLPIFNPYSGRFAGYAISKGKLTTELHYRIDDRQLQASHHVIIDQLEWGAATHSQDKVSLPIRLGTSLLKNREGIIDLDLPVTGSLDDPEFRVGPVIWQIVKNLIVKVATAPFDFLGGLFKGAEEARYVDFAPGSAALPEGAAANLQSLAQALVDKPELRLEIPSAPVPELDAAGIAGNRLQEVIANSGKDGARYAELDLHDKVQQLEYVYKQVVGHKPEVPEHVASAPDLDREQRKAESDQAAREWLCAELLARYQPSPTELQQLGQDRANAIQDALLGGGGLDPVRVFITNDRLPTEQEGKVRVELGLE